MKLRSVCIDHSIGISVKNMRSSHLNDDDSNGIGVENIRSMMQQMNGRCIVKEKEKTFEIILLFPTVSVTSNN